MVRLHDPSTSYPETVDTAAPPLARTQWARAIAQAAHRRLKTYLVDPPFAVRVGNSAPFRLSDRPPVAVLWFRNWLTLMRVAWNPEIEFGEAYLQGGLEVEGDLDALLEHIYRAWRADGRPVWRASNSIRRSRDNVHHHYDLGNEFYKLWLDENLVYTCAYYADPTMSLERAQVAKMDHVCRKLRLRPGETVLEAGCGWGALALHMARRYGARVTACNISRQQVEYARDRARREGLADRVTFLDRDYREVRGCFDAFVSIGMLEHVGRAHYASLGRLLDRCLHPQHGRGFLHFIGRDRPRLLNGWIRKRIFPGAYPPTLGEVTRVVLEPWSFSVLDVENLRLHYARTLSDWRARFEAAADTVSSLFDTPFVRAWRLYLAGSEAAFTTGFMQLFQVVFARPQNNEIPLTRADLYAPDDANP